MPRSQQPLSETRQLAVLRSCSAVFRVIYSREMARFLVYILEREPHYFVHPVICPLVVCPDPPPSLIPRRIPALSRNGWPRRPVTRRRLNPLLLTRPFISLALVDKPVVYKPIVYRSRPARLSRPIVKSRASFQPPRTAPPLRLLHSVENRRQLIHSLRLGQKRRPDSRNTRCPKYLYMDGM